MSVIRIVQIWSGKNLHLHDFRVQKRKDWLWSFFLQKRNAFCLTVSKLKRIWQLRKAVPLYDFFVLWHAWGYLWICSWGIPQPKISCTKGLPCWTKNRTNCFQTDWGNSTLSEQPSKRAFHYFMVPPKLGSVVNPCKKHLPDRRTEPFWNKSRGDRYSSGMVTTA